MNLVPVNFIMTQRTVEIAVEGTASLLCGNVQYSDPLGEYSKHKTYFTDKKGKAKTDGVHRAVRVLDWLYSGYWKKEGTVTLDESENSVSFQGFSNPYLPGANFQRCLKEAAKKWKLGKDVSRAIFVDNNPEIEFGTEKDKEKNALEMINSRTPKYQLAAFTSRGVWVNRLLFPKWAATFHLIIDDELMGMDQLRRIANMAGKAEGLGTWRPRYGRFAVTNIKEVDQ